MMASISEYRYPVRPFILILMKIRQYPDYSIDTQTENRDIYPIYPIDKFEYNLIKEEVTYNSILIYFFSCELDKKKRLIQEGVDESLKPF